MTTYDVAQSALVTVAQAALAALGEPLSLTQVEKFYPTDNLVLNRVAIWVNGDASEQQGLGTAKQWGHTRFRVDVFAGAIDWVETMVATLRMAWITDMNTSPAVNAAGQGYLRLTGGIKRIEFTVPRATAFEKSRAYFRRIFEISVEIGD